MKTIPFNIFLKVVERDFGPFNKNINFNFEQFSMDWLEEDAEIIAVKSSVKDDSIIVVLKSTDGVTHLYSIVRFFHNHKHWQISLDLSDANDIELANHLLHGGNMDNVVGHEELYHNID